MYSWTSTAQVHFPGTRRDLTDATDGGHFSCPFGTHGLVLPNRTVVGMLTLVENQDE